MAEIETCAVQRINTHKREVIDIGDASKPGLLKTIEFNGWDELRACAATEGKARSELNALLAGYCKKYDRSFVKAVLDCSFTRDGDVKIEKREKAVTLAEKVARVWRSIRE